MDEKRIYELLSSGHFSKENEGLKMLNKQKRYLLQKHRFPSHYNDEDRDDVCYKALMILLENVRREKFIIQGEASIEKYLYRTIELIILGKKKQRKEIPTEDIRQINIEAVELNRPVFSKEALEKVSQVFREKLGDICRQILIEKYYWGKSYKEIAADIGFQVNSTKNRGSSCLKELKKAMHDNPKLERYIKELLQHQT